MRDPWEVLERDEPPAREELLEERSTSKGSGSPSKSNFSFGCGATGIGIFPKSTCRKFPWWPRWPEAES